MSSKKKESNKRNAQLSTGPHDTSATRLNAMKHGLMAANLTTFDGELYGPMLEHFRAELQPQSEIEDLLVQRIALYATRLQRAASLSADYMTEAMQSSVEDADVAPSLLDRAAYAATGEMPQKAARLTALREAVSELPAAITKFAEGEQSPELVAALDHFSEAVEALPRPKKKSFDALRVVETLETRFQRYETQLENRMLRLLNELERIQRLRAGEAVPAPVNVNVAVATPEGDPI